MFDIGFTELLVIAVVALIVIGPERLPAVARTLGHLFGRMQRYVNDVKADIAREMELEELRRLRSNVEEAARAIQDTVTREVGEAESELNRLAHSAQPAPDAAPAPATAEPGPQPASHQLDLALNAGEPPAQKQA